MYDRAAFTLTKWPCFGSFQQVPAEFFVFCGMQFWNPECIAGYIDQETTSADEDSEIISSLWSRSREILSNVRKHSVRFYAIQMSGIKLYHHLVCI